MTCGPCEVKSELVREMTRGKFLGVGAAAAAGVGAMGVGVSADEEPQERCRKPPCGKQASEAWRIEASVLQVLWGDIFPRFVAYRWQQTPMAYPSPLPATSGVVTPAELVAAIHQFLHDLPPSTTTAPCTGTPPNCDLTVPDLTSFERRAKFVIDKIQNDGQWIPIRILGEGAFDFILSDAGLDLFAPRTPLSNTELLRFYGMRSPGRPTIGLPGYLDQSWALAFDVQAPVGPSQIWIDNQPFSAVDPLPVAANCTISDLTCLDLEPLQLDPELYPPRTWVSPPSRKFTIPGFFVAAAGARCWQLEGSVYRGIMEQLPRVVATLWHERVMGCSTDTYQSKFFTDWGLRQIFEDRLETTLPSVAAMVFETAAAGVPNLTDVVITNQGIRFPRPDATPPSKASMIDAIIEGRAGNPVFTDTKRPDRGV